MGGSVAVTIREEDGTEHRMSRWTNPLPYFITNIKFFEKDSDHLKKYLKTWHDMVEDYHSDDPVKRSQSPMADVYVNDGFLAPVEYGLIVVDLKNNVILDCQNYSSFDHIMTFYGTNPNFFFDKFTDLFDLWRAGRLTNFPFGDSFKEKTDEELKKILIAESTARESKSNILRSHENMTEDEIREMINANRFLVDMTPFRYIRFNNSKNGWERFRRRLVGLGFAISEEEDSRWKEFLANDPDEED